MTNVDNEDEILSKKLVHSEAVLTWFLTVTSEVNKPTAISTRFQFISETNDCNLIPESQLIEEISRITDEPDR